MDVCIGEPKVEELELVLGGRHEGVDARNGLAVLGTLAGVEIMTPELVESMVRVVETRPGSANEPSAVSVG